MIPLLQHSALHFLHIFRSAPITGDVGNLLWASEPHLFIDRAVATMANTDQAVTSRRMHNGRKSWLCCWRCCPCLRAEMLKYSQATTFEGNWVNVCLGCGS